MKSLKRSLSCKPMFFDGGGVTFSGGEATMQFGALKELLKRLKEAGIHTAIETNGTHARLEELFPYGDRLHSVIIMTVEPGFGGQKFIPYTLDKVRALRQYFDGKGLSTDIQVDGGVNRDTIRPLIEAGATRLRPVLMTSLTTILSMIPMAMGGGSSGSTTQGLAIVDIGGLTAGVLVALFMLPVYYALLSRKPKPEVA